MSAQSVLRCVVLAAGTAALLFGQTGWHYHLLAGRKLLAQSDFERAEVSLRMAVAEARKEPAPDGRLAVSCNELGDLYLLLGRYDEAEPLLREAVRSWEGTFGNRRPGLMRVVINLARLYLKRGQYGKAERLCARAGTLPPISDADSARLFESLGELALARRKFTDAEAAYRKALSICAGAVGPEPLETAAIRNNLAVVYMKTRRPAEAVLELERALTTWKRISDVVQEGLAPILANLGSAYMSVGRLPDAERAFRDALAAEEKFPGIAHPEKLQVLQDYAALLRNLKRPREAGQLQREAQSLRRQLALKSPLNYTIDVGDYRYR